MTFRQHIQPCARKAQLTECSNTSPEHILFAFMDDPFSVSNEQRPSASLLSAHNLARELGAKLHVLAVVRPREPFAPMVPPSATRALVTRWTNELLGDDSAHRLQLSSGHFFSDIAAEARRLSARLIILAPERQRVGRGVIELARRTDVPVLVARETAITTATIVAATDLEDTVYPVLRQATRFGDLLHASVVAVHNVNPLTLVGGSRGHAYTCELERRTRRLQLAARLGVLSRDSAAVIDTRWSTTRTVLCAALLHSASLVVVGTQTHKRFGRPWWTGVAARVVNRAQCSVLITPIRGPSSAQILGSMPKPEALPT